MGAQTEWPDLSEVRQPLRKISRSEKQRLRKWLKENDPKSLSPATRIRLSLAAGLPIDQSIVDEKVLTEALDHQDIAINLRKFARESRVVALGAAINALDTKLQPATGRVALNALLRLTMSSEEGTGRAARTSLPLKLEPDTGTAILKLGVRIGAMLLGSGKAQASVKHRRQLASSLIDLAFFTCSKCEQAQVAAVALELILQIQKGAGWEAIETLDEITADRRIYVVQLPSKLITELLKRSCLADANLLALRSNMVDEARDQLRSAVLRIVTDVPDLPLPSRNWSEHFLGAHDAAQRTPRISADSDANVERISTLLLAAWESREEGPKARHLFELFSSVCKSSFHLMLVGEANELVSFDPVIHEFFRGAGVPGQQVRTVRPRVQYSIPPVVRVIVRALVSPVEA